MTLGGVEPTVIGPLVKKESQEVMDDPQDSKSLGEILSYAVPAVYALFLQHYSQAPSKCVARSPRSLLPGVVGLPVRACVDLHDPRKV